MYYSAGTEVSPVQDNALRTCDSDNVGSPCMQCGNMAREGLRTLVVGKKILTEEQYASFEVGSKSR